MTLIVGIGLLALAVLWAICADISRDVEQERRKESLAEFYHRFPFLRPDEPPPPPPVPCVVCEQTFCEGINGGTCDGLYFITRPIDSLGYFNQWPRHHGWRGGVLGKTGRPLTRSSYE